MASKSLLPPEEVFQVLIESPGVIRQAHLREFVRLRESGEDWVRFGELRDLQHAQYEAGYLIEMGGCQMYVDHTGALVVAGPDEPNHPNENK